MFAVAHLVLDAHDFAMIAKTGKGIVDKAL